VIELITQHATPAEQAVIEAATVIVFRHGQAGVPEILMLQRARDMSFAASACVFPGGKVDAADHALAAGLAVDDAARRIAGIREVLEETGLVVGIAERVSAAEAADSREMLTQGTSFAEVLVRFGWTLNPAALVPFARWFPRCRPGRVFDTSFYLADLGTGQVDLTHNDGESMRLFWITARDAVVAVERGNLKAIYPTRRNLERLAQFSSFTEAEAHARSFPVVPIAPVREMLGEEEMLRIPEGLGYPVTLAPTSQISID
jgi:8-oxo-dGTP pyrophosphatase MutT (NUDIX family)